MPKSLAEGHIKVAVLTTKPADPENPTVTELEAGINAACNILASDFVHTATDSDKVQEKALCDTNNANALGASNFQDAMTVFRYVDAATGLPLPLTEDKLFEAMKVKGTSVWIYARKGPEEDVAWAAGQEIYLGTESVTDEPQAPSETAGYIKYRVPMEVQKGYPFIEVAAGA